MKEHNLPRIESQQTRSASTQVPAIHAQRSGFRRRSFLKRLGLAGAALLPASALLATKGKAEAKERRGKLSKGDVAILSSITIRPFNSNPTWPKRTNIEVCFSSRWVGKLKPKKISVR
jgi:hypothetical protein